MASPRSLTLTNSSEELVEAVRQSKWKEAITLLPRLDCASQHRQEALREILKKAPSVLVEVRLQDILSNCTDELLGDVFSCLVESSLWNGVGRMMRKNLCSVQHTWAVQKAIMSGQEADLCVDIVPHCAEEHLEQMLRHAVLRKQWLLVDKVLERGVSSPLRKWAVQEALNRADEDDFATFLLHHCSEEDLELVSTHMVTHGLWKPEDDVTHTGSIAHILSQIVSRGLWKAVGKFLQRDAGSEQHAWAVGQASTHADDDSFLFDILPQCSVEELEGVMTQLVSRCMWWSVDSALDQGVSTAQCTWTVDTALKRASEEDFATLILPYCTEDELGHVVSHMVSQGLWIPVDSVTECEVSVTQHILSQLVSRGLWESVAVVLERYKNTPLHQWAICEAAKHGADETFDHAFLSHCSEDDIVAVFPVLVANKKWKVVKRVLYDMVCETLNSWITSEQESRNPDTLFWKFIDSCRVDASLALGLTKAVIQETPRRIYDSSIFQTSSDLAEQVAWQRPLCEALVRTLLHTLCFAVCSGGGEYTDSTEHTKECVTHIYSRITDCITNNISPMQLNTLKALQNWIPVFKGLADTVKSGPVSELHFLQGLNLYTAGRQGQDDDAVFVVMLAVLPLGPQLQSVVLRMMLRDKRWDIISQACLTHLWEHDRRQLFKAAVEQSQWSVVKQWVDHSLHDDQRDWAMKEALKEKQLDAYLLLADHGLARHEHMHAMYIVAKYGDWHTVLEMVERGGDITEVSNLLENWVTGNLRMKPKGDATVYSERGKKLIRLRLHFEENSSRKPWKALQRCKWGSVLFSILHRPLKDYFSDVLAKVKEEKQWHILMHLVRLGMNQDERNQLFPEMVRQQQWGVCRKLLEHGVDEELCLEALPELMKDNQWMLVSRVMEYNMDDAARLQVMQYAFQRREGVLFWHCLTTLKNDERPSVDSWRKLFHQAISRDIWQAVKPLVEDKDDPGIRHRDIAFLEAIEQHLWDVVDHCQVLGADINMEDENGETPLHREARKEEWKAVEEIVFRDGKPNLLDMHGVSVLNRLINHREWDTVKFVIKYGGNIHLPAKYYEETCHKFKTSTPLQRLIDHRQSDVIQFTVMWCPEQHKGVNEKGETTLHAVCGSGRWDVMKDLIMRKVDPTAVTKTGQTALVHAVLSGACPHRMVAECSRLGFTTHQPSLTDPRLSLLTAALPAVRRITYPDNPNRFDFALCHLMRRKQIASPFVCAVLRDMPDVVLMLYESGSCSMRELFTLFTQLHTLLGPSDDEIKRMQEQTTKLIGEGMTVRGRDLYFTRVTQRVERYAAFIKEAATTPRTLLSCCRLHISHQFRGKRRLKRMRALPVPEKVKKYLDFSDFLNPAYGKRFLL